MIKRIIAFSLYCVCSAAFAHGYHLHSGIGVVNYTNHAITYTYNSRLMSYGAPGDGSRPSEDPRNINVPISMAPHRSGFGYKSAYSTYTSTTIDAHGTKNLSYNQDGDSGVDSMSGDAHFGLCEYFSLKDKTDSYGQVGYLTESIVNLDNFWPHMSESLFATYASGGHAWVYKPCVAQVAPLRAFQPPEGESSWPYVFEDVGFSHWRQMPKNMGVFTNSKAQSSFSDDPTLETQADGETPSNLGSVFFMYGASSLDDHTKSGVGYAMITTQSADGGEHAPPDTDDTDPLTIYHYNYIVCVDYNGNRANDNLCPYIQP